MPIVVETVPHKLVNVFWAVRDAGTPSGLLHITHSFMKII
jgi:hypothetical protein